MIKLDYYRRHYRPWNIFLLYSCLCNGDNLKFLHKKY